MEETIICSFDVALATHDDLRKGITEAVLTRVIIAGKDDVDCALGACQLAHAMWGHHMVTGIYMRV